MISLLLSSFSAIFKSGCSCYCYCEVYRIQALLNGKFETYICEVYLSVYTLLASCNSSTLVRPDLNFLEFEDNVWDEFDENDDLIVPHSGSQHNNQFVIEGDGYELYLQNLTQNERMPEKDSSSDTPEDSGGSKLCADDTILGEKCGVEHDGVPASLSMFNESDKKSGHKDALVSKEK
ncbi:hypothetical protein L195_g042818, partial [Trifolium pratense]